MKPPPSAADAVTFELNIHSTETGYVLQASTSSAGETIAALSADAPFEELLTLMEGVQGGTVTQAELQELGERLYASVLPAELEALYRESVGAARERGERLAFRLLVEPVELAGLPWEILYDKQDQTFLALSDRFTFARTITVEEPARDTSVEAPLRVLVLAAGSTDSDAGAALDTVGEIAAIQAAFAEKIQAGAVSLEVIQRLEFDAIRARLKAFSPHVLHIVGHAQHTGEESVLFLEDESGSPYAVGEEQLRDLIGSATALHLVVLNACDSAKAGQAQGISGLAQRLLQRQVPGVVAMQAPVGDAAAVAFAVTLYTSLAAGETVEEAVTSARQRLHDRATPPSAEWLIPVFFARTRLGPLFQTEERVEGEAETKPEETSSIFTQSWKRVKEVVDVLGAIGAITALPAFLAWLHEVWGPFSCVPDTRLWGVTTVGLLLIAPLVAWVHWKQALPIRRRWFTVLEVCLALVLVLGFVRSVQGAPPLPVLPTDTFNIVVTTFGEGGRYTFNEGRQQVRGNSVCNSVKGLEFTNELLISLDQKFVSGDSAPPNVRLQGIERYIHSQEEALELAKDMHATVLVWGWLLASDDSSFGPQFVVNDPNEAWEPARLLTGLTSAPDKDNQVGLTQSRIEILTDFILGIFSMQQVNESRAQQYFQRSLDSVLSKEDGTGLLPLLYYYTGRMDNHLGHSVEAEAKFDAGLALNREYAILYLNKGNILYSQARQKTDDPAEASALLDQATELYQRALTSLEKESTQFVDGKAHANLGHVAFTRGQMDGDQSAYFQKALQEYETAYQLFAAADAPGCNGTQVEISMAFVHEELKEIAAAETIYESIIADSDSCTNLVSIAKERLTFLGGLK